MSKDMILVSSGFILPSNRLFSVITKDSTYRNSLLNKRNSTGKDFVLNDLIKTNSLSSSSACNELYAAYVHDSSIDNFLNLVDAITEVFKGVTLKDFLLLQARNTYLSPTGFRLCMDLVSDKLYNTYREYLVVSSFFRVTNPSEVSQEEINNRINQVERMLKDNDHINFTNVLANLVADKGGLVAFFQYVLTDSNRGGLYG